MKNSFKKLAALLAVLVMVLALAACGGGVEPADTSGLDNAGKDAEPNNGMLGIVFAVPEGWNQTTVQPGEYAEFTNPDSEYSITVGVTTEDSLKASDDESISGMSVQEFYKKYYARDKKWMKENNVSVSTIKVCDTDADFSRRSNDNGIVNAGTTWLYDNVVYDISLSNWDNYGDDGKMKDDAKGCTDEALAAYEYLVASVRPGDGAAAQNTEVEITSIGSVTFDKPEGFKGEMGGEGFASFVSEDSDAIMNIQVATEDDLANFTGPDGKHPESLKEEFESYMYEGVQTMKIAGHEGYFDKFEEEDGNYYSVSAGFLTDDAMYTIYMQSAENVYDENGLIDGVKPLTDKEIAAFETFLKSIKER